MKKFLYIMLSIFAILCAASCSFASYHDEGNTGFTEASAYILDSIEDFTELKRRVNNGTEPGGRYYRLVVNLDLRRMAIYKIGAYNHPFTGHFDGNGNTLTTSNTLFDYVDSDGIAIKNLDVISHNDLGGYGYEVFVAGIVNVLVYGTVQDCNVTGICAASEYGTIVGGIAGSVSRNGIIKDCKFNGEITSESRTADTSRAAYAGGIVGRLQGGTVENCQVKITDAIYSYWGTSSTRLSDVGTSFAGGIAGEATSQSTIKNNIVTGIIRSNQWAGGIVGYMQGGTLTGNVMRSVSAVEGNYSAGGIAGYLGNGAEASNNVIVLDSNVSAVERAVGGVAGRVNISATVKDNRVYTTLSGRAMYKGKLIGEVVNTPITVENNYYNVSGASYTIGYNSTLESSSNIGGQEREPQTYAEIFNLDEPDDNPTDDPTPEVTVTITKETLLSGRVNSYYSDTLTADVADITWSVSGNFPSELDFDENTGEIYGTPKTVNTYNFTARATHTSGSYAEKSFTLTINAAPSSEAAPSITTTKLKAGKVGKKYTPKVKASGKNITWSASGLPAGVEINPSTGKFSGLPENSGTYNVRVTATNSGGADTKTFSVVINDIKPNIKGKAKAGKVGVEYFAEFYTTKGTGNIVWTLTPEDLPEGLEYDYDTEGATIEGTPEETWKQKYTLTATNSAGSKTKKFTLKIKK